MTDPRVEHWWDESKALGTWYASRTTSMRDELTPESKWNDGEVLWDAYLLYDADSRWEGEDGPTHLIHWGRTVVAARGTLEKDFETLFP